MSNSITGPFLKRNYKEISKSDAPHIFDALKDLNKKVGNDKAKFAHVYVLNKSSQANPILEYLVGCMRHDDKNVLLLSPKMLDALGQKKISGKVTPEVKAVLAHEMGHAFHNDLKPGNIKTWSNRAPLIGLIGGVAGAYLAQKIFEKHPDNKDAQKEALDENSKEVAATNGSLGVAAKIALYTAGAGLGIAAGLYTTRLLNHKMEFRADAFSKQLMKSGAPLKSALIKISEEVNQLRGHNLRGQTSVKAMDERATFLQKILHPPIEKRIDALTR